MANSPRAARCRESTAPLFPRSTLFPRAQDQPDTPSTMPPATGPLTFTSITGTNNLVLGLLGGMTYNTTTGVRSTTPPWSVRSRKPQPRRLKTYPAYIDTANLSCATMAPARNRLLRRRRRRRQRLGHPLVRRSYPRPCRLVLACPCRRPMHRGLQPPSDPSTNVPLAAARLSMTSPSPRLHHGADRLAGWNVLRRSLQHLVNTTGCAAFFFISDGTHHGSFDNPPSDTTKYTYVYPSISRST